MIRPFRIALVSLAVPALALAQASKPAKAAGGTHLTQSFRWYDGARVRTAWLDPSAVAEFDAPEGAVPAVVPGATLERRRGGMRIWKLPAATGAGAAARLARAHPEGRFLEVFRDGPIDAARPRALPGGVIVQLDRAWEPARVDAWIAARGLTVVRRLPVPNMLVVKTAPGLESLRTANALYESGEVVLASPDWALSYETR